MPLIRPIPAITYLKTQDHDVSAFICPPYDVLDKEDKRELLKGSTRNLVAVDLPHLPAKTVGPDEVYDQAGNTFRRWLDQGILNRRDHPALFVYQQTFQDPREAGGSSDDTGAALRRRGLVANVKVTPFGVSEPGQGGVHPHEKTHSGPKEDRLKLMRACQAQLSPIFGIYSDPSPRIGQILDDVCRSQAPDQHAYTPNDQVQHDIWAVDDPDVVKELCQAMSGIDAFIADGHHRYTTAINYLNELEANHGELPDDHPAKYCMFVLVSMHDPGMIVLPTHRVLGGLKGFGLQQMAEAAKGVLRITPFSGPDLASLEAALSGAGPHAMGLYCPSDGAAPMAIATPIDPDPLGTKFADRSDAWRSLDVALVQHLIVDDICQSHFCPAGQNVAWKYPHTLNQVSDDVAGSDYQLGVVLQATPLKSVIDVSQAGELMPQKSTFFFPKIATGLVINPLGNA